MKVAKKIRELMADHENMNVLHESHELFKREHDEQLVQWMNRYAKKKGSNCIMMSENAFKLNKIYFSELFKQVRGKYRSLCI